MAREPYRSRMLRALLSLPEREQLDALREFVVHEAGSSHSDVIAADNMERIVQSFRPFATGYPDQRARDPVPIGGQATQPWWV